MTLINLMLFLVVLAWVMLVYSDQVGHALTKIISSEGETVTQLEWRRELVLHASFMGTAVAAFLGFTHESKFSSVVAAAWFFCGLWYSRSITNKLTEIEAHEQSILWRKSAGMIRSVVKSEIARDRKENS